MPNRAPHLDGPRVPPWLLATLAGGAITVLIAIVKLTSWHNVTNERQDERLGQIEHRQEIARGIVDRVDARDRDVHDELAKIRERLARLERNGGQH